MEANEALWGRDDSEVGRGSFDVGTPDPSRKLDWLMLMIAKF